MSLCTNNEKSDDALSSSSSSPPRGKSNGCNNPKNQPHKKRPSSSNDKKRKLYYCHDDMVGLNLLNNPVWVFDIINKKKWWANTVALEFWNSPSLEELLERDYSKGMSDMAHRKNLGSLERLKRNERWTENWTLYPKGKPKSVTCHISRIFVQEEGHICCFVEARVADDDVTVDKEFLRDASMLRYLPMTVSQFDNNGKLMRQNPEAEIIFGSPLSRSRCNNNNNHDDDDDTEASTSTETTASSRSSISNTSHETNNNIGLSNQATTKEASTSTPSSELDGKHSKSSPPTTSRSSSRKRQHANSTTNSTTPSDGSSNTNEAAVYSRRSTRCKTEPASKDTLPLTSTPTQQQQQPKKDMEQQQQLPDNNDFLDRFVDKSVGCKLFQQIKEGKDVDAEILVNTIRGPAWNAIHARLGKDAISKDPIILFSARDISDLINAKKEIQLNAERAEFFAIMSHEIRTPLFQVTGFIDLLDQTTDLSNEQREYVKLLKASTKQLMTVINDIMDYSKLEAGKMKLDIVPFEPKAVVDGCLAAMAVSMEEKGLVLTKAFETVIPVKLLGDPNRLRQILLNLLQNAVKFTHTGGIEASVSMKTDNCRCDQPMLNRQAALKFSIKDSGIGIDSKQLSNIFRQYDQGTPSIATVYGGTGLGLSICKSLVELMGGCIGVDSILGTGSTFWFEIPFELPKIEESQNQRSHSACCGIDSNADLENNLQILVAEDNKVNQKLTSRMLRRLGHTVTVVENGEEAVQEVQQRQYDLILMDMQMPVKDGIDATKEIRCLGFKMKIMGLTASVRRADFENIGLDDWIGKPVRLKELQDKLSFVGKHR